jgi:microcystin degradation protein MlrC
VHIWLDDEELGWSAVAVTDANAELAAKTADEIADVAWSIRAVPHPRSYSAQELVSCVPLRDAEAALSAWSRQIGESVTLTVGGKLETRYNRPLEFTGKLLRKTEGELGKTVVLRDRGAHLIVSELAPSATQPRFFTDLGLGVWRADIVVVKNLFPFRYSFLAVNRGTLDVETPGTSSVNVFELGYKKIPRPIYPLDPVESWR